MKQESSSNPNLDNDLKWPVDKNDLGACFEALVYSYFMFRDLRKSKQTMADALAARGIKRDLFYDRLKTFHDKTKVDLKSALRAAIRAETSGNKTQQSDNLFAEIQSLFDGFLQCITPVRNQTLRLGTSQILCRAIVAEFLSVYLRQCELDNVNAPKIDLQLDFSGRLNEMIKRGKLDVSFSLTMDHDEARISGVAQDGPILEFHFCLACKSQHPAAKAYLANPATPIGPSELLDTTLILVGPHLDRAPQYVFPKAELLNATNNRLTIREADTFDLAHNLAVCGTANSAVLTVPEFLDDEQLRSLIVVPNLFFSKSINPIQISLAHRSALVPSSENDQLDYNEQASDSPRSRTSAVLPSEQFAGCHSTAVEHFVSSFQNFLHKFTPITTYDYQLYNMSRPRHIYYERTVDLGDRKKRSGNKGQAHRAGWAHSIINWNFLRNGVIQGIHKVDKPRNDTGELIQSQNAKDHQMSPFEQEFRIVGRFDLAAETEHDFKPGNRRVGADFMETKLHLSWTGEDACSRHGGTKGERYLANFVCTFHDLMNPTQAIYGRWAGVSNTTPLAAASGYMVIAPERCEIAPGHGDEPDADPKHLQEILSWLSGSAKEFEKINALTDCAPCPKQWEWEVSYGAPKG